MKKLIIIALILFSINANSQINTYRITDINFKIAENPVIYFLPRSVLNISLDVEIEHTVPGPYNQFADKYLSIKNVPTKKISNSKIKNVKIDELYEADPNACFAILKSNKFVSLNELGIISAYNTNAESIVYNRQDTNENNFNYFDNEDLVFTNYSMKTNFTGRTDTTYRVVEVDSIFQKIPVYNTVMRSKTEEQKAEEAANHILNIRANRFLLQSGMFENENPPHNIDYLIDELNKEEQKYLELFIGKKIIINSRFTYSHIPENNGYKSTNVTMFYLSDEYGILEQQQENAKPIILNIENIETTQIVESFYKQQLELKEKNKGLYYRIPGTANVSVVFDNIKITKKHLVIPQLGHINYLSSKIFDNKNLKIMFDQKSGSITRITNE